LKGFIERERDSGIFLSVLGFGQGNYNDATMQALAQNGNGNAAYIDNLNEARKVLVQEAGSTLFTIAKDVKIQVEFNPAQVAEYRLIGYETRLLNREDFNNDKVDAGDVGSGHAVTALYEITPAGGNAKQIDDLRYREQEKAKPSGGHEYAFLKLRYKLPEATESKLMTRPVTPSDEVKDAASVPHDLGFAASVAGFGELLRGDANIKQFSYDDVIALAQATKGDDPFGYRAEFINLVRLAKSAAKLEQTGQPRGPRVSPMQVE
jgi:Ca-activated chloride channel family protein